MKTVRFTRVVERAGQPHVHTLWVEPNKDAEFRRARDAGRVMTLASTGGKTEAGLVGYHPEQKSSEYLIFPKSLRHFDGKRVVGIKFDLVEQPKTAPAKGRQWVASKPRKGAHSAKAKAAVIPFHDTAAATKSDSAAEVHAVSRAPAPKQSPPKKPKHSPEEKSHASHDEDTSLVREVRHALKELEAGKAVAAYHRLQRAIS